MKVKSRGQSKLNTISKRNDHEEEDSNDMFSNLFLLFFGSGTFSVPWGFARAGLIGGTIGVFGVAILTYLTICMLVKAKRLQMKRLIKSSGRSKEELQYSLSYAAIATYAIGSPKAGYLVKLATTLSSVGACGGYLIFVVGLLTNIFIRMGSFGIENLDEYSVMMLLLPVIIPLTWIRSFQGLAYVSAFGNFVFIGSVAAVLYDGWTRFGFPSSADFIAGGGDLRLWPESASSYTLFISPCIFLFTVHYCALPIEAEGHKSSSAPNSPNHKKKGHAKPFTPSTPLSSSLRYLYEPNQNSTSNPTLLETSTAESPETATLSCDPSSCTLSSFDTSLLLAIIASALLNAMFGACSYVLFGRAKHAPQTSEGPVSGCDAHRPFMCDNVVKNLSPGPLESMVSVALILNIAISYVLMLAPSRQYIEAAVLSSLSHRLPSMFSRRRTDGDFSEGEIDNENGENGGEDIFEDDNLDNGVWVAGKDNWARAWIRNILRTVLVLFTAKVALTVPHFALITGLIGGMTDSLQSLVLPPIIYIFETVKSSSSSQYQKIKYNLGKSYASINQSDGATQNPSSPSLSASSPSLSPLGTSPSTDVRDEESEVEVMGWSKKLELGLCCVLAVFGGCFIIFATSSNIRAIEVFL